MNVTPLSDLDAHYLEFTTTKGSLHCHKDPDRAQGLYFLCPQCLPDKNAGHGITVLFELDSVPKDAQPHGRWLATKGPLSYLTLDPKVPSPTECGFSGYVTQGKVRWK